MFAAVAAALWLLVGGYDGADLEKVLRVMDGMDDVLVDEFEEAVKDAGFSPKQRS